jgi:hypothetical protein
LKKKTKLYRLQEKLQALKDREEELLLEFQGIRDKQDQMSLGLVIKLK